MINVGITGAGGLVGEGLVRTLLGHPGVELVYVESSHAAGKRLDEEFPGLAGMTDVVFDAPDLQKACSTADVMFLAHKGAQSMAAVPEILAAGRKVIDIGGEFRLRNAEEYEKWYGGRHTARDFLSRAVYGLPELFREQIEKADLVANPGCYPTGLVLLVAPFLKSGLITDRLHVSGFSGLTGAGRRYVEKTSNLFIDVNENIRSYAVLKHRHQPEMSDALARYLGRRVEVSFAPHLIPADRGILTVVWAEAERDVTTAEAAGICGDFYGMEPFVRVRKDASDVLLKNVFATNYCDVGAAADGHTLYLVSAIDNTTKGAVTQAVQNMNIMFGIDEGTGITGRFV
ncbi:MAG: N-acetyl-gamma-glutamyl-phosphate reductase [Planctomycetes bacterium]|nr:N-acetyl-gamma-glutamyl-phosphate reductase [Planctomycetota bacterium]